MSRKKDVSIRFIAEQCGVSTATVSRVLNGDERVSDSTRTKVIQALEEYRYTVSPLQETVKIKRIGAVIPSGYSEYYHSLLREVGIYFRQKGVSTIAMNMESMQSQLPVILDTLYDCHVSGIILIGCDYLSIREKLNNRIPHVWIDCNDTPDEIEPICQVQSDQFVAGQMAAELFLKKGCRKPIIICDSRHSHREKDRIKGFRNVFENNKVDFLDEQLCYLPGIKPHVVESQDIIRYLVTKGTEFDSVFAISDGRAIGAYIALRDLGLRIPEDVKLMAFDGIAEANISVLNITSIHQNIELIVRHACNMLTKLVQDEPVEEKHILVPTDILAGQTM